MRSDFAIENHIRPRPVVWGMLMKRAGEDHQHWSAFAEEWLAWARKPNHDAFWAYRDSLVAFIGSGNGKALDVGSGEGRVSRELAACGFEVTAVDPASRLVTAAIEAQSAQHHAVASATALPFESAQFDLVVAYNVLMDVEDVPTALKELRRVMRPTGQLIISIVHPLVDHGHFADEEMNSAFVIEGTYFGRQRFEGVEERDGLRMHFAGWRQSLEAYGMALEEAGLAITSLREPVPDLGDGRNHMTHWVRMPLFLWLKARPLRS
jgi:2-polyprenyl-3-methyl-5-hydroxy-6-metoxy-1,4-benzoquinol methylase